MTEQDKAPAAEKLPVTDDIREAMALIRREDADIDYNIFSRLGRELRPGMIWVTSGAAEIGRLDYIRRTGHELSCDSVDAKTDYAAQGQSILMEQYRHFIRQEYSVRQVLVEHQHFRIRDNGASEQSTLQLSARQVADRAILHIGELHQCDSVGKALGIIVGERVKPFPLHARCNHLFHSDGELAVDKVFLR